MIVNKRCADEFRATGLFGIFFTAVKFRGTFLVDRIFARPDNSNITYLLSNTFVIFQLCYFLLSFFLFLFILFP